jgi:hypothetical protein
MRFLVPQGLGDSVWCLLKVKDLTRRMGGGPIDLRVACWRRNELEERALDFLRRFNFVNSVESYVTPRCGNHGPVLLPGPAADSNGYYRYMADGPCPDMPGVDYALMPNAPLERGIRLEEWLPGVETDWEVMRHFLQTRGELLAANDLRRTLGEYVVFYTASLAGNTAAGHNRCGIWRPEDWAALGDWAHERYGVQVVLTGASYDRDYWERFLRPLVAGKGFWHDFIGSWPIAQTMAVLDQARFVVSYQSGIGITSHYLGRPVAIFWRKKGDSISPGSAYVSFEEGMSSAWARPDAVSSGKLMPCIYGRHGVSDIATHAAKCGW